MFWSMFGLITSSFGLNTSYEVVIYEKMPSRWTNKLIQFGTSDLHIIWSYFYTIYVYLQCVYTVDVFAVFNLISKRILRNSEESIEFVCQSPFWVGLSMKPCSTETTGDEQCIETGG